jgi:hypothetical protein
MQVMRFVDNEHDRALGAVVSDGWDRVVQSSGRGSGDQDLY